MKPLSALLDLALVPLAIAADAVTFLPRLSGCDNSPSYTRQQLERVEEDMGWGR